MKYDELVDTAIRRASGVTPTGSLSEQAILCDLIKTLASNRTGLRRSSVMHALRRGRDWSEIPLKFEDEVERVFRYHCIRDDGPRCRSGKWLFFRPLERAGEVWALLPEDACAEEMTCDRGPSANAGEES